MKLQDEKVIFIRSISETWDVFENQEGIQALPKYDSFIMIPEGKVGSKLDYRVIPNYRKEEYHIEASRWATHYAIICLFLKSDKNYLFVSEDTLGISEWQIPQIEILGEKGGLHLIANTDKPSQAYIVDRTTAKIIQDNAYVFYESFDKMLRDMQKLDLITIELTPVLDSINNYRRYLNHIFIFLMIAMALGLFYMLCPIYSLGTKNCVGFAEVFTAKETIVSA
jgi:hypothetical protein